MKISKIICLALALILSATMLMMPGFASENSNVSDIEFLSELGIVKGYEDGELHPEYNITRMEYAALIIRCLGYDGDLPSLESVFTDVPKDSWGAAAVQFAYDLGIINGYGDGRFGPDDNILEVDAVKIIVSALGRGLEAEAEGGYPTGYLSVAKRLGVMEKLTSTDALATRGYVATLLANSLNVSIVEQNFTSNSFVENQGRTILSILGISRYKGMLTAVNGVNIGSEENVLSDEVVISGRTFKTDKAFNRDYVGEQVNAYIYRYGETDEKLIALFATSQTSKNITVKAEDISGATSLKKFVYTKDNREKEIDLPAGLSIVYNGTLLDRSVYITPERLKPVNGQVKLMDTDNDGNYELALVTEYRTYVVRTVTDDAIYDIYGNSIIFENNEENSAIFVKKNGKTAAWEDITAGSVLSVASSMDKKVAEIMICDEIISEKVISTATRDGKLYYGLESGEYVTTLEYNVARSAEYREALKIEIGNKYRFRLNSFGEIAVVEEYVPGADEEEIVVKGDEKYGFLTDAAPDNTAMSEALELRLLTTNNRFEYFTVSGENNVRFGRMVNGAYRIGKATPSEIYSVLKSDGVIERQIVKYVLGEDGTIREFYLADDRANSANLSMDSGRTNHIFSQNTIEQKWYYNEDTVLFLLTGNGQNDGTILCSTPGGYLTNRTTYNSELWDIDSDGFINCICLYPATGESINEVTKVFVIDLLNDPVMLVTYVGQEANDDGIIYKVVEGYVEGELERCYLSESLAQTAAIRPGMVIQYGTNSDTFKYALYADDDEIMLGYIEMFDFNDLNEKFFVYYNHKDSYSVGAKMNYGYATVTKVDDSCLTFNTRNIKSIVHTGTTVLKYNTNSGIVEKADITQINEGQKVFFRKRLDNLREVIIID